MKWVGNDKGFCSLVYVRQFEIGKCAWPALVHFVLKMAREVWTQADILEELRVLQAVSFYMFLEVLIWSQTHLCYIGLLAFPQIQKSLRAMNKPAIWQPL